MNEKRRILMIGNQFSGKTTYMASAYGLMRSGKYGFNVRGDDDSDEWLVHLYRGIKKGEYPLPTDKRSEFSFDLFYYHKKVLSFEWIDYFGGVITESAVEQFSKDIESSDAIMLFLDADALKNGDTQMTQFRRIRTLITEKLSDMDSLFDVIVVLTKYDLVEKEASFEEICKPLEQFKMALEGRDNIDFRIVPVSCTENGFVNVDLPLIQVLHKGLLYRYYIHHNSYEEHKTKALSLSNKLTVTDWLLSKIFGAKTNGELLNDEIEILTEEAQFLDELLEPTKQICDYLDNYPVVIPSGESKLEKSIDSRRSRFGNM